VRAAVAARFALFIHHSFLRALRCSFNTEDTEATEGAQSGNIASQATGAYLVTFQGVVQG